MSDIDEQVPLVPNGVSADVFDERTKRLEAAIENLSNIVITKFVAFDEKTEIILQAHTDKLDKQEEDIHSVNKEVKDIGKQVTGILQWKEDGEKKRDVWFKWQVAITSVAVLLVGLLSNMSKVILGAKVIISFFNGGG